MKNGLGRTATKQLLLIIAFLSYESKYSATTLHVYMSYSTAQSLHVYMSYSIRSEPYPLEMVSPLDFSQA